jgi:hypothetical protein
MSGYLQRLVDTAAGRADSVHPRTGSIFSPREEERRGPLQGWDETEQTTLAHPQPHQHAAPLPLESSEPPRGVTPRSGHAPLLPRSTAPDSHAAAHASPYSIARHDPAGDPVDPLDDRSSDSGAERRTRPVTDNGDVYVTLPAPESRRAGDTFRPVMKPPRASEAIVVAPGARQPYGAQGAQQADDIQIHIGRIEVLAVPPPAPRAPKAPDRSLSLDAYLNRRDGRAK